MVALLDMQGMASASDKNGHEGGGSDLSVLLCDSFASFTLCL